MIGAYFCISPNCLIPGLITATSLRVSSYGYEYHISLMNILTITGEFLFAVNFPLHPKINGKGRHKSSPPEMRHAFFFYGMWRKQFECYFELEHLMWRMSTLGGACSAMADYDLAFAKRAGVISERQMRIAAELDDHTLLARCYLYIALSEAQQARFAEARKIVRYVLSLKWYFLFVDIGLSSTST
ncbi:unnamed protein product [Heligmosomoides polygyrus]|uniref:Uncharacterized protein n=1 Tax=Heligmosomoides polygyrus TaxID=6339 RepID=A0A183FVS1_HELPZ|nr:unnamed protein product [Heligmosomoides polygyrus]